MYIYRASSRRSGRAPVFRSIVVHGSTPQLHLSSSRYRCYSDAMTITSVTQPFVFIGGGPRLGPVDSVAWTQAGPVHERLTSYEVLTRWTEGAGLLDRAGGAGLRGRAPARAPGGPGGLRRHPD